MCPPPLLNVLPRDTPNIDEFAALMPSRDHKPTRAAYKFTP
jgi:hypothetical protein